MINVRTSDKIVDLTANVDLLCAFYVPSDDGKSYVEKSKIESKQMVIPECDIKCAVHAMYELSVLSVDNKSLSAQDSTNVKFQIHDANNAKNANKLLHFKDKNDFDWRVKTTETSVHVYSKLQSGWCNKWIYFPTEMHLASDKDTMTFHVEKSSTVENEVDITIGAYYDMNYYEG